MPCGRKYQTWIPLISTRLKYSRHTEVRYWLNKILKMTSPKNENSVIISFSRCFYPEQLTVHSGYTFLSVCVFAGNWTHNFYTADTMLYHWATGTHVQPTAMYAPLCHSKSVWLYSGTQKKIYWRMLVTKPFQFPLTSIYLDNKYSKFNGNRNSLLHNSNTGLEQHEVSKLKKIFLGGL